MKYEVAFWNGELLGKEIALDYETSIAPFHTEDHKPILGQAYDGTGTVYLFGPENIKPFMDAHKDRTFIFQNAPFDLGVMRKHIGSDFIYGLIDNNQVTDTKLLYQLYYLAAIGSSPISSSLKEIAKQLLNVDLDKNNDIRMTFGQYEGKPIEDIPHDWLKYASEDAVVTFDAYCQLLALIKPHDKMNTLLSHHIQIKGSYALNMVHKNGIGFNLENRDEWLENTNIKLANYQERLATYGWVRGMPGIKSTYENIVTMLGIADKLPRSEKADAISSKEKDLERFKHIPFIKDYCDFNTLDKMTAFVRNITSNRIHPSFNTILRTGRVSCYKPNLQQIPREGGLREMFIADPGKEFYIIDYSGMENAMLGQVLTDKYGSSTLADTINDGVDVHKYYASILFDKEVKDVTKTERQQAKAAVFGFPGGLGIETFREFALGYGVTLSEAQAQVMKDKYFEAFPEMEQYLKDADSGDVFTLTGRKRGDATYCAVANTPFQGLGADMAKIALYDLTRAGFKVVGMIHDEFIIEEPIGSNRYNLACDIMVKAGSEIAPDMKIEVEGGISDNWKKM